MDLEDLKSKLAGYPVIGVSIQDQGRVRIDVDPEGRDVSAQLLLERAIRDVVAEIFHGKIFIYFKATPVYAAPEKFGIQQKRRAIPHVRAIVAIAAGKGGVGKSSLTTMLALALQQQGWRTGIVDADIYGPSQAILLGIRRPMGVTQGRLRPVLHRGIYCSSMALLQEGAAVWRGPLAAKALDQLIFEVEWPALDILFVDLPPGTGDIQISLVENCPLTGILLVTTPHRLSLVDADKAWQMFRQLDVPIFGMIANMVATACAHCGEDSPLFPGSEIESFADARQLPIRLRLNYLPEIASDLAQGMDVDLTRMAPVVTFFNEDPRLRRMSRA